jgi:pimeloyl-ACP methyl ester carboxylesterase
MFRNTRLMIFCTAIGAALVLAAGCATPVGVRRVGIEQAYQQISANAFTGPALSDDTRAVLRRYGLLELYGNKPISAINELYSIACSNAAPEVLFALSETSYGAARQFERATWVRIDDWSSHSTTSATNQMIAASRAARAYDFASAIYAYFFLFPPGADTVNSYDPRFRIACNLYNCGLAKALKPPGSDRVEVRSRVLNLPMGKVTLESSRPGFPWTEKQFHEFVAADEFIVRGLSSRTREPGLGVPLIAIPDRAAFGDRWPPYYAETVKVPATAFLKLHGTVRDMAGDGLKASLELYCPYNETKATVNGHPVPLEIDLTAPMAYNLEGAKMWQTEFGQFFSAIQMIKTSIYLPQPYEHGKIPVVLVHGTTGSPARWAEMCNTLEADPVLRTRYQFWYFIYNSGQPVVYSAMLFREGLDSVVKQLDPRGEDPALHQMIVIGHSQGGLLTRLAVVHSGDRLWANVTDKKFDDMKMSPEARALLRRTMFFEPSPYISRVVFLCTPHRGSYRIRNLMQKLVAWMVDLPSDVRRAGGDLMTRNSEALPRNVRKSMPTSVDNMKPGSPFVHALDGMEFKENVKMNSIIAVLPGQAVATGNDGVVSYDSAHIEGVESECIVRAGHSCQGEPAVVEEVRRILVDNLPPAGTTSKPE